ncbi:MAG: PorT family protein [Cyclobacteriaceae bacterium]|nr:PorT family protein [Cyclobacteriaceae bacterium]
MMKITIYYIGVFCCALIMNCTALKAQNVGLRAGMNVSTIGGQELGYLARVGYHGGIFYEHFFSDMVSLHSELSYSLQGAALDPTREVRLNYHYLNMPLVFRLYFLDNVSFNLGGQISYLLSARLWSVFGSMPQPDRRNIDAAVVLGFGYLLSENICFGLNYNMGLLNAIEASTIIERRHTNQVLQISMYYNF